MFETRLSVYSFALLLSVSFFSPLCFAGSNGFILIEANGGLNQQRSTVCAQISSFHRFSVEYALLRMFFLGYEATILMGNFPLNCQSSACGMYHHQICVCFQICNAVAVAKLLNATLIIPHFHLNSVWKDPRCGSISPYVL